MRQQADKTIKITEHRSAKEEQEISPNLLEFFSSRSMIIPSLIILAYIFLVTFTPNWNALDTSATRFMTLSVINLVGFAYLLSSNQILGRYSISDFFTNNIGLAYSGFLIMSFLSFTQAINMPEAIVHFAKLFAVFSTVFIFWMLIVQKTKLIKLIIVSMTLLLIFDTLWVFQQINQFIKGNIYVINEITTIYSNKNILSASIFLKLPFALSMLMFDRSWFKHLAWGALFFGMLAIFLLASRAFYIGLLVLTLAYSLYLIILYANKRDQSYIKLAGLYLLALAMAFVIHSLVQQNLFPQKGRHTQPVPAQLAIIRTVIQEDTTTVRTEASTWERLDSWRWSIQLIKNNMILGVGTGNWKVDVLKHENQENPGFVYMYKAHNDFLENAAETGIIGGLFYLAIYLFIGWSFLLQHRKNPVKTGLLHRSLLLAFSGMGAFAVDAFFNFPSDRPVISIYWILFVSIGMAAHSRQKDESATDPAIYDSDISPPLEYGPIIKPRSLYKSYVQNGMPWMLYILAAITAGVLFVNYQSSVMQRIIIEDINTGKLTYEKDLNIGPLSTWTVSYDNLQTATGRARGFPKMPGISLWGESFHTLQARYLIEEEMYDEAIRILKKDKTNPWDSRREFLLAVAYESINQPDSALKYSKKAYRIKPNYLPYLELIQQITDKYN